MRASNTPRQNLHTFSYLLSVCRVLDYDNYGNKVAGGNCGDPLAAQLFFVFYALVMLFIVIEMFVNVIMEKFEEQAELSHLPITTNDIMDFADVWSRFDPKAHGRIPVELMAIPPDDPRLEKTQDNLEGVVVYPGGEQKFKKGFLEELSERLPLLGANPEFEEELSEKVSPPCVRLLPNHRCCAHCRMSDAPRLVLSSFFWLAQLGTKKLECPGPTPEDRQNWLKGLRVPAGRSRTDRRYLKPSHIETAKSMERADDYFTFHEVLYALCERRAGRSMPPANEEIDNLRVRAAAAAASTAVVSARRSTRR